MQKHPERLVTRVLWLTDTYSDHNGVSMVLQSMYAEIRMRDLPIDIMVCSDDVKSDSNLIVLKPVSAFHLPMYRQQPFRIPNYLAVQRIFRKNKYDCIICSTEGPMGFAALYLKKIFGVKTVFYLHTDWLMFAKQVLKFEKTGLTRLQRIMRMYYNRFDHIFVLNSDQYSWLIGKSMKFDSSRVFLTAHWVDQLFRRAEIPNRFRRITTPKEPVLLYAGRLSPEKGIFELPEIFRAVKRKIPALKMIIAGTGPSESELKQVFPEAVFLGWIDHNQLPEVYQSADLLILPSRFDTFSCVVLEALSCGLPVIAYNTKGPKDIILHTQTGYLCETMDEFDINISRYFKDPELIEQFKAAAEERAKAYSPDTIIRQMMTDLELTTPISTDVAATA